MDYRVFVTYNGLTCPLWIDSYLKENFGVFEKDWWCQCVTDNWDCNTNCYYFRREGQADRFEFIARLAKEDDVSIRR